MSCALFRRGVPRVLLRVHLLGCTAIDVNIVDWPFLRTLAKQVEARLIDCVQHQLLSD